MEPSVDELASAALKLHSHILERHWNRGTISGPDPGIRFNARIGRFIKSYLAPISWSDDMVYLQAQGYWILDNWIMARLWDRQHYRDLALACSEQVLALQRPGGYWDYPNPEWRGRIATVEGCFAALGLLESYSRLGQESFLIGVEGWYQFLLSHIGFRKQPQPGQLAVNYFAHHQGDSGGVSNNSTLTLWFLAKLAAVSGDAKYLSLCDPLIAWVRNIQTETGELPYALASAQLKGQPHFLCYQYNAFEFMDLVHYYRLTGDQNVPPILERLGRYLSSGLTDSGAARYDCRKSTPEVGYHTSAVAQALRQASSLGLGDYDKLATQAYQSVTNLLGSDEGSQFFSRKNYCLLSDRRSYPRYLAMILNHLLREISCKLDTVTW